jgi:hypothetical protein
MMHILGVFVAGAGLCWAYLSLLQVLLFSRRAERMSLLLAITAFIEGTAVLLAVMFLLSDGRVERLLATLFGFVTARLVLMPRVLGSDDDALPFHVPEREPLRQQPLDRLA